MPRLGAESGKQAASAWQGGTPTMGVTGNPVGTNQEEGNQAMERNAQQRRRVFAWVTSLVVAASVFAPAAAWAEMIVKPGH